LSFSLPLLRQRPVSAAKNEIPAKPLTTRVTIKLLLTDGRKAPNYLMLPTVLNRSAAGLTFLGYRLYPYHIALSQRSKQRFFQKMDMIKEKHDADEWNETICQKHAVPLIAFAQYADTQTLLRTVMKRSIAE